MSTARALIADGRSELALHICTADTWIVAQRSREAALGVGDAALLSSVEVGSVTCPSAARCTNVMLPRKTLSPLVVDLDAL